jgi:hypothetical protein
MERLVNRQQILEVNGAINRYMQNKNDANFDRIFNEIREYNLDPARFIMHACSNTTARVVDGLLDLVRKNAAMEAEREGVNVEAAAKRAVTAAVNMTTNDGYGETPLVASLQNPDTQQIEDIVRVLVEHGANPNLETDDRENFFNAIYEDEMNSGDLPGRMAMLQRIRDLLNKKQFNSPRIYQRFRPQAQAAPQAGPIGGKKKKMKTAKKGKKGKKGKKDKRTVKRKKSKKHRK